MHQEPHTDDSDQGSPVCPHCLAAIDTLDHFCPRCGGPVSAHASIDPLGQVYSAGHLYRRATSSPPKFITVLGMWLIFGPQIPLLLFAAISLFVNLFSPDFTDHYCPITQYFSLDDGFVR